jgi:chromosome segregation ATPase
MLVVLSLSSEEKKGHIPYRDSKLTRLLQPSLSGNARMVLLCCISPLATHLEESHNTFKFATRAKKIKQKAVINVTADEKTLLQNYREEIDDLRNQLEEAKAQQQSSQEVSHFNSSMTEDAEESREEVLELVEAIKTMERLILKSRPLNPSMSVSTSSMSTPADESKKDDSEVDLLSDDDEEADLRVDVEVSTPPSTPKKGADDLHIELSRIRGLLGSVLQKRGMTTPGPSTALDQSFDYASPPPRMGMEDKKVETLRKQLERQELTTSLRKADSSFLQNQLREKDKLLEEVSKVLEAVEKRQAELESENVALRAEIKALKSRFTIV